MTSPELSETEDDLWEYEEDDRTPCSGCGDHRGQRGIDCEAQQLREFRETYGPYGIGGLS